jgi:cephalosporin-C deacetylase
VAFFDLPLSELRTYRPEIATPPDLAEFWLGTVSELRAVPLAVELTPVDNKLQLIDTFDVEFTGWGGAPIRAWLHVPAGHDPDRDGPLPTVVQYHGYSGGRGFPHADTIWAQAGWAHLALDTRGQGWRSGGRSETEDPAPEAGSNHAPGFMTLGLMDPERYYYRRVYADAFRLLDVAAALPHTDADRLLVTGRSQGGGITIAVAGLAGLTGVPLRAAAPDVPFLCHIQRAVEITDANPYAEITNYLAGWRDRAETAYRTLSYFDGANLGRYARVPALFSVALMDLICPPSTVFAAYHHFGTQAPDGAAPPTEIAVYSHNGHEGGDEYQVDRQLTWFAERFG